MSKELEALEILKFLAYAKFEFDWDVLEKPLKALEIIKKKRVNIYYLEMWWLEKHTYEQYIKDYKDCDWGTLSEELLAEEEYDLLKEVLV